ATYCVVEHGCVGRDEARGSFARYENPPPGPCPLFPVPCPLSQILGRRDDIPHPPCIDRSAQERVRPLDIIWPVLPGPPRRANSPRLAQDDRGVAARHIAQPPRRLSRFVF